MRRSLGYHGIPGIGQRNINTALAVALYRNGNFCGVRYHRTAITPIVGFDRDVSIVADAQHHPARRSRKRKQDHIYAVHDKPYHEKPLPFDTSQA